MTSKNTIRRRTAKANRAGLSLDAYMIAREARRASYVTPEKRQNRAVGRAAEERFILRAERQGIFLPHPSWM